MPSFQVNAKWAVMSEVIPNLYICGVSALKPQSIVALNFDLVVNCTKEVPNMNLPPDVERLKLWLDDTDDADLRPHFECALDYIRMILEADGRALVHCVAGVSRSAAICMAYLMKYQAMTLREAYDHLAARRPRVRPNLGLWKQLIQFESEMRNQTTVCIIDDMPDVYDDLVDTDHRDRADQGVIAQKSADQGLIVQKSADQEPIIAKKPAKRQRQNSDGENGKRFVPKLEPVLECEQ